MYLSPDEIARFCPPLPSGGLHAPEGPLPLTGVEVSGTITGLNAALTVTQTFRNDRPHPIEAVYTFPLPDHFAVAGLTALLGDREIVGRIDERGQARRDYEQALADGNRAALVEQERGDVFTAQLGNLPTGEEARITLRLAGRLGVDEGEATFRFPLLVGERYHPGVPSPTDPAGTGSWPDTDQVPDASRVSPPRRPEPTGVALRFAIDVVAGGLLTGAPRVTRTLQVAETESGWRLTTAPDADLDRDLVARIGVRRPETTATAFLATDSDDPTQGTWQVIVSPPEQPVDAPPRSIVLALDRSGSMHGWKIVAARRAAARIIDSLGADDSFLALSFDHLVETGPKLDRPVAATDRHRYAAVRWLGGLEARGGTELAAPLERAATALADASGARILVLVTDGQVGNEAALLKLMATRLQGVRVYALGVDQAVNATFLRRLAAVGGGRCDLVESEDQLDRVLQQLHRRIAPPLARGIAVAAQGVQIDRGFTTPELTDLFPAGPAVVQGRWRGQLDPAAVRVSVLAETDTGIQEWSAPVTRVDDPVDTLRNTWARARLEKLQDRYDTRSGQVTEDEITDFSLAHQVLSPFTAWLAVGPGGVTGPLQTVVQPVVEHIEHTWGMPVAAMAIQPGAAAALAMPRAAAAPRGKPGLWSRLRGGQPATTMAARAMPDTAMPGLDLAPFADRLRDVLNRFAAGGDPALARELAELVSDLESVGAPAALIAAVTGLPDSVAEVRAFWKKHTGAALD
jgi:Ca-activated chloride channel family protein